MRWAPLVLVAMLVVGVLLWQDPTLWRGSLGASAGNPAVLPVPESERIGPCAPLTVVDGDTLDLDCGGREERVRLLRIDTPERDEPGHREAREALESLLRFQTVHLVLEQPGQETRDRYGRLLGYVYAGDRNLNVEMVRLGWSPWRPGRSTGRFAAAFAEAERFAREEGNGSWAE